jgi:predicted double-glycine peptidase
MKIQTLLILSSLVLTGWGVSWAEQPAPYRELRYTGVVGQTTWYTCGPAAASTLLQEYYQVQAGEQEITDFCLNLMGAEPQQFQVNGKEIGVLEGVTALALQESLAHYGLQAQGYRLDLASLADYFDRGGLPIILHVTKPQLHYILAEAMIGEYLLIADPSWGRRLIKLDDLMSDKGFSGVALVPVPNSVQQRQAQQAQAQALQWATHRLAQLGAVTEVIR